MVHLIAPDDVDPDDALEARCLRERDGAPALEPRHIEEQARDLVLMCGDGIPLSKAHLWHAIYLNILEDDDHGTPY